MILGRASLELEYLSDEISDLILSLTDLGHFDGHYPLFLGMLLCE